MVRKSSIVRFTALALLCGGLWLAHTQQGGPQPSKLNTVKLKDDLYVIHNDFVPGNTTALITSDGVLLVDDADGDADMDEHVVAQPRLRGTREADVLDDAGKAHARRSQERIVATDFDDFSWDGEAHGVPGFGLPDFV